MDNRFVITISCVLLLSGCSPKIMTSAADKRNHEITETGDIYVYGIGEKIPDNSKIIGNISVNA